MAEESNIPGLTVTKKGTVQFPPEVEAAIASVLPSEDPLDQPDFDVVDYINNLFPTVESLSNLDDVIAKTKSDIHGMDQDVRKIVCSQTDSGKEACEALLEAQSKISELFTDIRDIKQKASESEAMVRDITRDIKQLDVAKRNLTNSITTLNHLHMLINGVTTLQQQTRDRQYESAAMLLQGLGEVLDHFKDFKYISYINELADSFCEVKRSLSDQINQDFKESLSGDNASKFVPTRQLAGACLVMDVLDPKVKNGLLKWLVDREMAEYKIIFADNEENSWLDRIETRYSWLKRHLIEFEERLGPLFPAHWEMSERVAVEFCDMTKKQLEKLMFRRRAEIDSKLLLHAIQKTVNFEALLARRFTGETLVSHLEIKEQLEKQAQQKNTNPFEQTASSDNEALNDPSNPFFEGDPNAARNGKTSLTQREVQLNKQNPFDGIISHCFEPYLNIYIESQNRNIADLVDRAAQEQKARGCTKMALEGSAVLHSCGDLFMFYKKCMVQCSQLSTGDPLLSLTNVFKRHLREYATKVLIGNLPKTSAASSATTAMTSITKDLKDFSKANLIQNFQSLLKEGENTRLNDDEKVLICTFLVTSEYCLETTQQLESKLKEKIDANLSNQVNLSQEQDIYHSVINSCIQLLVQDLELCSEPSLIAMTKVMWNSIQNVGDQSSYVTSLMNHMNQYIPLIRDNLANSRKYFTQFCVKFVNTFIPKFVNHMYKCKPISTVGAEQLLLDTHLVKTLLLNLPTVGSTSTVKSKAPASYTKIVNKAMSRAEILLKIIMSHEESPEEFVEQCIKLVPDIDMLEFQKVLDMKGVRKVDQTQYMDLLKSASSWSVNESPSRSSTAVSLGEESRIKKLENLIKKRI